MNRQFALAALVVVASVVSLWTAADDTHAADDAQVGEWGQYQVGKKRTGYTYAQAETRAMQDDDFDNPGYIWVERGADAWATADGAAGQSCQSCHQDAAQAMAGVGARYPVYAPERNKLVNLEQRINQCRVQRMHAEPWEWESDDLLGMTAYVRNQSLGMAVSPVIDGPAAPFYEAGKAFYLQRRGQLDLACIHCHEMNHGRMLRAQRLSQGQSNGFPTYRLKWQKMGSLHRRLRGCNNNVRAEPYPAGADEYVNLELYLAWRASGLPVETPAVRN